VPVTLILVLVGLSYGMVNDSRRRAGGVGADVIVRAPNSNIMSFSGATIPEQLLTKLRTFPHVTQAMGTVNQSAGGPFETATGIDPAAFDRMSGGFDYVSGHGFRSPGDIILDSYYADQKHVRAGQKVNLMNRDWNVSGIVQPGKLSHIFVELPVLQDLFSTPHMLSVIYLKADDPNNVRPLIDELKKALPDYPVYAMQDFIALTSVNNVPLLSTFINVIIGIGSLIAFAVVCLSMYMAVLQRTREIGILKAIGATQSYILRIILAEALVMGVGGTVLGVLFSFGSRWVLHVFVPSSMPQAIVINWWWRAGAIALTASLLGALYPGVTAARQDPIKSLAYE
jgi:putative ABC transport system permease protein